MVPYTGANLKARILIALAENPLDTDTLVPTITVNEPMNEMFVRFSMMNVSYQAIGVLPLSDLPELNEAIRKNMVLQQRWLATSADEMENSRQYNLLHTDKNRTAAERYEQLPEHARTPTAWAKIKEDLTAEYAPRFDALAQAAKTLRAAAQPGLAAAPDLKVYLESIDQRAEFVADLSRHEEEELARPPAEWCTAWDHFIQENAHDKFQAVILTGFRAQSDARVLIDHRTITGILSRIGDARKAFAPDALQKCMDFANEMAYKRAPFLQPVDTDELVEEESESVRP